MPNNRYDAVIFDLDDTLTKTWRAKWDLLQTIGSEQYGLTLSDQDIEAHFEKPLEEKLRLLYKDDQTPYADLLALVERYNPAFPRTLQSDALVTLTRLEQAGILTGIVTGGHPEFVQKDLTRLDFPSFPLGVHCYNTASLRKPQPEVFDEILQVAREKGIQDKARIISIGDSLDDYRAARDAGIAFIGLTAGKVTAQMFQSVGALHFVPQLSDIVPRVTNLPVKVGGILLQNERLLVVRNKDERHFIAPGGSIETAETPLDALVRELHEELSISVSTEDLLPFGEFKNQRAFMSVFQVTNWQGKLHPANEVEEMRWITANQVGLLLADSIFTINVVPQLYQRGLLS